MAAKRRAFITLIALVQLGPGALVIAADALFNSRSEQLAALTNRHRVPSILPAPISRGSPLLFGRDIQRPPHNGERSPDYLIRLREHFRRDGDAKSLCGLKVDHELMRQRCLDR